MPIYAYACRTCGHAFDRLQKLSDPDPEVCPACGAATVHRQVTAPAFRLAGSGWYETDFKKDGDKKHNLADAGEPAKKEESSGASQPRESAPTTDKTTPGTTPEKTAAPASATSSSGASPG